MLGFHRALKKPETQRSLLKVVWPCIRDDLAWMEKHFGPACEAANSAPYEFLDNLLHGKNSGLLIFIDQVTDELREIVESMSETRRVEVVKYQTFRSEQEYVHLFLRQDERRNS